MVCRDWGFTGARAGHLMASCILGEKKVQMLFTRARSNWILFQRWNSIQFDLARVKSICTFFSPKIQLAIRCPARAPVKPQSLQTIFLVKQLEPFSQGIK